MLKKILEKAGIVILIITILIGVVIIVYPFWPIIKYQINPPKEENFSDISFLEEEEGDWLVIPKIGVRIPILEGSEKSALEKGAWLMPDTSTPDKGSNTVITAHRFKYTPPSEKTFYLLDKLVIGDTFKIYWEGVEYNYQVVSSIIVLPTDLYVLEPTSNSVVNLITCTPLFSTKQRLVVQGELYETLNK